ncbi:hypothetical protein GCM10009739_22260 [Microbacterium ulmi]
MILAAQAAAVRDQGGVPTSTSGPAASADARPAVTSAVTPAAPRPSRRAARAQRAATGQQPVIADAPVAAQAPVVADAPVAAQAPVVADAPVAAHAPVMAASPTESHAPVADMPVVEAPPLLDDVVDEPNPVIDVIPAVAPAAETSAPVVVAPAMDPVRDSAEDFELIEPADSELAIDEAEQLVEGAAREQTPAAASDVDAFEAAARLFSFTGETPVQAEAAEAEASEDAVDAEGPEPVAAAHVAPRRSRAGRVGALKRVATTSFSIGVVGIVGLLAVGMTTPAQAVAAVNGVTSDITARSAGVITAASGVEIDPDEMQVYVAPAEIQNATLDRTENYATVSVAEVASELGISNPSNFYVNDPNAAIQWPFAVGVGITFGFGMRDGQMHQGADFVPGNGSHVQAIADGVVRISTDSGGAFGVTVVIDHIIDGQLISSRYAHMQVGSRQVSVGQHVTVGTFLGRTGNTGRSFGAHTHVEILKNGTTPIDPIAWFRANAGRDSLG